jgi:hypothetical protein
MASEQAAAAMAELNNFEFQVRARAGAPAWGGAARGRRAWEGLHACARAAPPCAPDPPSPGPRLAPDRHPARLPTPPRLQGRSIRVNEAQSREGGGGAPRPRGGYGGGAGAGGYGGGGGGYGGGGYGGGGGGW